MGQKTWISIDTQGTRMTMSVCVQYNRSENISGFLLFNESTFDRYGIDYKETNTDMKWRYQRKIIDEKAVE